MNSIILIRNAILALAVAGAFALPVQADESKKFAEAIEKAETARQKAASVNGEWRDTGKIIKQAEAAAKKGEYGKALHLANIAYRQGELGYQQAMSQKNAGFPSYMR